MKYMLIYAIPRLVQVVKKKIIQSLFYHSIIKLSVRQYILLSISNFIYHLPPSLSFYTCTSINVSVNFLIKLSNYELFFFCQSFNININLSISLSLYLSISLRFNSGNFRFVFFTPYIHFFFQFPAIDSLMFYVNSASCSHFLFIELLPAYPLRFLL